MEKGRFREELPFFSLHIQVPKRGAYLEIAATGVLC